MNHLYLFDNNVYSKLSLAVSNLSNPVKLDRVSRVNNEIVIAPFFGSKSQQEKYSMNYSLNKKFNAKNNLNSGIITTFIPSLIKIASTKVLVLKL